MDRDLALDLLEILTAIKVAVQTIANGGTPPEVSPNVQNDSRNVEPEPETETRSAKTTTTKRG